MKPVSKGLLLTVVVLVGINLRPAMASVSPMLEQIKQLAGLSDGGFSMLTTIPVLIMGLLALALGKFSARLPTGNGVLLAMLLIAVACVSRYWVDSSVLVIGSAVLAGLGIALAQVLLPGLIKRHFAHNVSMAMGLYTTAIMGGAALASGLTPWVQPSEGTGMALAIWAAPALLAALAWMAISKRATADADSVAIASAPLSASLVIRLCLMFGIGTGAYVLVLAWLPGYYQQFGRSEMESGLLLSVLTMTQIVAGLGVSFLLGKLLTPKSALIWAVAVMAAGLAMITWAPLSLLWPCVICLGLSIGALFPLSMIVILDHAEDHRQAASLAAVVQGFGYLIASAFPYVAGLIRSQMTDLTTAWLIMLLLCAPLMVLVLTFYRRRQLDLSAA